MANETLIQYIKEQLQAGAKQADIKKALEAQGWPKEDIDGAFLVVGPAGSQQSQSAPTKKDEKDTQPAEGAAAQTAGAESAITAGKSSDNTWKIIIVSGVVALAIIIGGIFFALERPSDEAQQLLDGPVPTQSETLSE